MRSNLVGAVRKGIAVVAGCVAVGFLAAAPAIAGVGGSVIPAFPTPLKVGDIKTATITITNNSTPNNNTENVSVTGIFLLPSCADSNGFSCNPGGEDPGVFLFGTALGKPGTACEGKTFAKGPPNPGTGEFELIPTGGLLLGPSDGSGPLPKVCVININFQVIATPKDSTPPDLPLTTESLARATLRGTVNTGNQGPASGGSQTIITPVSNLTVTKDDGTTSYVPGTQVVYTVVVTNPGPSPAPGTVVADNKPTQVTSWTWECLDQAGGATGCDGVAGSTANFTDTIDLPVNGSVTYRVTALIGAGATGSMVNTASATPPGGTTSSATDTDTAAPSTPLAVTKNDGTESYVPGMQVVYTIVVSNPGPSDALGVQVADNKPAQVTTWTWVCSGSTGTAGGCTGAPSSANNFTDTIDLPAVSSITYTVTALIGSGATGSMTNTVTAQPPVGNQASATDVDTAAPSTPLAVTKDDGTGGYTPGVTRTYTIVVSNPGPSDALGVLVADNKPAQVATWTWVCSGFTGTASGCTGAASSADNFTDTIDLPAVSSITYTVTAVVSGSATGDMVNTVTATPVVGNVVSATDTDTLSLGIGGGHFDFDIYYGPAGKYKDVKHTHEYDDKYDVTGVNMLNASLPAYNLINAIPNATPDTQFKILVMNQYLNPAAFLAVGPGDQQESVKTYGGLASAATAAAALAQTIYTREDPAFRLIVNLPETAFNSINWWGDGSVRAGAQPTQTGCVTGVANTGATDTPGPNGERSNGALTIQIIKFDTPEEALELNHSGGDLKYGWRVKLADFATYVLAEYTLFWHHPNGKCYGQAGWVQNPPLDLSAPGGGSTPASGSADPKGPIPPNPTPVP